MSHVVSIDVKIKNLKSLKKVCKDLGLTFNEGQKQFKWYGRWMDDYHGEDAAFRDHDPKKFGTCDHAISCPKKGAYEIGVIENNDGTYSLIWDNWSRGQGLEDYVGPGAENLTHGYKIEETKQLMKNKGYSVREKTTEDGTVQLVCEAY